MASLPLPSTKATEPPTMSRIAGWTSLTMFTDIGFETPAVWAFRIAAANRRRKTVDNLLSIMNILMELSDDNGLSLTLVSQMRTLNYLLMVMISLTTTISGSRT